MSFIKMFSKTILLSSLIFSVIGCGKKVAKPEIINDPRPEEPVTHEIVSANIGASGGELKDGNNLKINIPSGALDSNKNITAQYIEEPSFIDEESSPAFLGGIEFGPSGTSFEQPVEVTINLANKPINNKLSVFCYDADLKYWDYVGEATPNSSGSAASFEVTHFSKYEVLDLTPEMYYKCLDLTYEAVIYDKPDTWIRDSYRDYLINEKHVMDYYTTFNGYYYEPCGLFVYINYEINGRKANQDDTYIHEGEDNSFGNTYGLSNVGGLLDSKSEFEKKKESTIDTVEIFNVTVVIDYKMITPQIELSATEEALKKGESSVVYVYTHYAKPSNKLFPDIVLPNYPLSLPLPLEHLYTNKTELTTNGEGKTVFVATSRDGEAETIEVNFTVGGYFGTSVSNYVSFAAKKNKTYSFTGTVSQHFSVDYWLGDPEATGASESTPVSHESVTILDNSAGTLTIELNYNMNGIITWTDNYSFEGVISYTGVSASVVGSASRYGVKQDGEYDLHDGQGNPYHEEHHQTTRVSYTMFSGGGGATINPLNQVAFTGVDVFGLSMISFDDPVNLPIFIKYVSSGTYAASIETQDIYGSQSASSSQSGSKSFHCEYWFTYGAPLMAGLTQKEGTQTITKDNYVKNNGYLADPYDPDVWFDNETGQASTTQTITLTRIK